MDILKSFKLNWWQAGFFKASVLSLGIMLGVSFPEILSPFLTFFWIVFVVSGIITVYYWYKQ